MNPLLLWFHQTGSPPNFDRFCARWAPWAWALAFASLAIGVYGALYVVPADAKQGENFRILYLHVPAAWMSLFIYVVMAIQAFIALVWRIKACEILAMACAPVGAAFTLITLATGSIWGRPTWGTWWEWDGRLTSMLILFFLYLGYIALASAERERGGDGRMAALFGVVGAVNLPIIHYSVLWWRTLHQGQSISVAQGSSIAPELLWPLPLTMFGFTAIFAAVALMRMRAELARQKVEARLRRSTAE